MSSDSSNMQDRDGLCHRNDENCDSSVEEDEQKEVACGDDTLGNEFVEKLDQGLLSRSSSDQELSICSHEDHEHGNSVENTTEDGTETDNDSSKEELVGTGAAKSSADIEVPSSDLEQVQTITQNTATASATFSALESTAGMTSQVNCSNCMCSANVDTATSGRNKQESVASEDDVVGASSNAETNNIPAATNVITSHTGNETSETVSFQGTLEGQTNKNFDHNSNVESMGTPTMAADDLDNRQMCHPNTTTCCDKNEEHGVVATETTEANSTDNHNESGRRSKEGANTNDEQDQEQSSSDLVFGNEKKGEHNAEDIWEDTEETLVGAFHVPGMVQAPTTQQQEDMQRQQNDHNDASCSSSFNQGNYHNDDEIVWVQGSLVVEAPQQTTVVSAHAVVDEQTSSPSNINNGTPTNLQRQVEEDQRSNSPTSLQPSLNPNVEVLNVVVDEEQPNVPIVNADRMEAYNSRGGTKVLSRIYQRSKIYLIIGALLVVTGAITWTLDNYISWSMGSSSSTTNVPTTAPNLFPTEWMHDESVVHNQNEFDGSLSEDEEIFFEAINVVADFNSSQGKALQWLLDDLHLTQAELPLFRLTQRFALATLFFSLTNVQTVQEAQEEWGWLGFGENECEWQTMAVSAICIDDHLLILDLVNEGLSGTIPPELSLLTDLVTIDLSFNAIEGSIPTQIGSMTKLESFVAYENELSGPIPTEIGQLSVLKSFLFFRNQLTSTIPTELTLLPRMESLILRYNHLTGSIPSEFQNLKELSVLDLQMNEITGTIPSQLGRMTSLTWLDLSGTQLSGTIPTEFGRMVDIYSMFLDNIPLLSGTIPSQLEFLSPLNAIRFHNTSLVGKVPDGLCTLQKLEEIVISCSMVNCTCGGVCRCMEDPILKDSNSTTSKFALHGEDTTISPSSDLSSVLRSALYTAPTGGAFTLSCFFSFCVVMLTIALQ